MEPANVPRWGRARAHDELPVGRCKRACNLALTKSQLAADRPENLAEESDHQGATKRRKKRQPMKPSALLLFDLLSAFLSRKLRQNEETLPLAGVRTCLQDHWKKAS